MIGRFDNDAGGWQFLHADIQQDRVLKLVTDIIVQMAGDRSVKAIKKHPNWTVKKVVKTLNQGYGSDVGGTVPAVHFTWRNQIWLGIPSHQTQLEPFVVDWKWAAVPGLPSVK